MVDLHYDNPKLVELYDLGNGWDADLEFYLSLAGKERQRVLDLGCGTGALCNAFAQRGHLVTGLDPAPAMLEVGRSRPFGHVIEWIQSSAQQYCSEQSYDLVVMTGHTFQVLLDDRDVTATFSNIRRLLSKEGLYAFESRNPKVDWANTWNGMRRELQSPSGPVYERFAVRSAQGDRIVFETEYTLTDQALVSVSELRFMSQETITKHLVDSGLHVRELFGHWNRSPFDPERSREMIFVVGHG